MHAKKPLQKNPIRLNRDFQKSLIISSYQKRLTDTCFTVCRGKHQLPEARQYSTPVLPSPGVHAKRALQKSPVKPKRDLLMSTHAYLNDSYADSVRNRCQPWMLYEVEDVMGLGRLVKVCMPK